MAKRHRGVDRRSDAAGGDIHTPHRGMSPNRTGPHLLGCQLGKPDVPRFGGIPTARKGDGTAGKGSQEEANAIL